MIIRLSDNYTQFYIRAIAYLPKARIKLIENNVNKLVGLRLNLLNTDLVVCQAKNCEIEGK
ncbi:hypothetical protein OA07_18115 [Aphanizomenon flos-aquae 2012/KM1/D3]|nr:hypothetical protein OA07_18115 [Aphanizomenon flos-aquae 2012/KM1/D3]